MSRPSAPSNQTVWIHHNNQPDEDSPPNPPELLLEETLEFQEEYPWEMAEEVEEEEEGAICYVTVGTFARRGLGSAKQRH